MKRFFKESIVGILLLSATGSLIASWLSSYLPAPVSDDTRKFLFQPIPVVVLFPYSLGLVLVFAVFTKHWHEREQKRVAADFAELEKRLKASEEARYSLKQQMDTKSVAAHPIATLMRFVAVVLSAPADSTKRTHDEVCKQVAGLAGPGFKHDSIGSALGRMLEIGAVRSTYRGLELADDWQARLARVHLEQMT